MLRIVLVLVLKYYLRYLDLYLSSVRIKGQELGLKLKELGLVLKLITMYFAPCLV